VVCENVQQNAQSIAIDETLVAKHFNPDWLGDTLRMFPKLKLLGILIDPEDRMDGLALELQMNSLFRRVQDAGHGTFLLIIIRPRADFLKFMVELHENWLHSHWLNWEGIGGPDSILDVMFLDSIAGTEGN